MVDSFDARARAVVDGAGPWAEYGPHYSRRTPGSASFVGVGQEVVLLHRTYAAVWSVVRHKTPAARGSGGSRGRSGTADTRVRYVWRNNVFRRLPPCPDLASECIANATTRTYEEWIERYGTLPSERLRTEIDLARVTSSHPGYCYLMAGWKKERVVSGKLYMLAPPPPPLTRRQGSLWT